MTGVQTCALPICLPDLVRLVADDDRVPRIGPALVSADHIRALREQVDDLALALVSPLSADDDGRGHERSLPEAALACAREASAESPDDDPVTAAAGRESDVGVGPQHPDDDGAVGTERLVESVACVVTTREAGLAGVLERQIGRAHV